MDNTLQNLEEIGLSGKEARVYLALLELGQSPVSRVADRAQVNRSTTYVILRRLRAQGLVLELPNTKKHEFLAENPEKMIDLTHERLQLAERIIPSLRAKQKKGSGLSNFRFYQGVEGLREAFQYRLATLANAESVAFFGGSESISAEAHKVFLKWYRDSRRLNISVRAIAPSHDALEQYRKEDIEHLREVRMVPHSMYPSELSIEIFSDMVRVVSFIDLQIVIIESADVARSLRAIFEMCWQQTRQTQKVGE